MLGFDDPASDAALIKACIELVGIRDFSQTVRALKFISLNGHQNVTQNVALIFLAQNTYYAL